MSPIVLDRYKVLDFPLKVMVSVLIPVLLLGIILILVIVTKNKERRNAVRGKNQKINYA